MSAVAVNSGLATEVTAARSAWANGTAVVHIEDARVFTRPSHWLAASLPRPSCGRPRWGRTQLSATRYPRVHVLDGDQKVGVDCQAERIRDAAIGIALGLGGVLHRIDQRVQTAAVGKFGGKFVVDQAYGLVDRAGDSADESWRVGQRPHERDADRGGRVRGERTAVAVELGVPAVAFDSAAAGTPRTGSRKRASSSRAAPPYSGVPFTLTSIG